jgi:hypothetical protein
MFLWWHEDKSPAGKRRSDDWLIPLAAILLGGILGGLSLIVLPTTILRHEAARLLNLVASPFLSGTLAWWLSQRRVQRNQRSNPRLHFWFAFTFSVVFLVVRFTWAHRPGDAGDRLRQVGPFTQPQSETRCPPNNGLQTDEQPRASALHRAGIVSHNLRADACGQRAHKLRSGTQLLAAETEDR